MEQKAVDLIRQLMRRFNLTERTVMKNIFLLPLIACLCTACNVLPELSVKPEATKHRVPPQSTESMMNIKAEEPVDFCENFNKEEAQRRAAGSACYCPCACSGGQIVCAPCIPCNNIEIDEPVRLEMQD